MSAKISVAVGLLFLLVSCILALTPQKTRRKVGKTCTSKPALEVAHSAALLSSLTQQTNIEAVVTLHNRSILQPRQTKARNVRAPAMTRRCVADNNDISSYESALEVLRQYQAIHGDLVIPRRYVVPADDRFPKAWHGVQLARSVYNMKWWLEHVKQKPDRVAQLNRLGFVWQRLQPEWNLVLEALITFSSLHGHVMVPIKFVVPHGNDIWPKATWGIALGNCVYRIRARNDFLHGTSTGSRRDQLDGLGFVWDIHEHRFRTFYGVLRHFARLNQVGSFSGDGRTKPLRVPCNYEVPTSPEWPSGVWGYPLGARCTAIRQKELYIKGKPERRQMLVELGFHWSGNADFGWLRVSHAAAIYSRLHKRKLDVPCHFKVPAPPKDLIDKDEWPWPEHLWGLPLGQRLKDVRSKGAYLHGEIGLKRRMQLDALGFNWTPKKRGRPRSIKAGKE